MSQETEIKSDVEQLVGILNQFQIEDIVLAAKEYGLTRTSAVTRSGGESSGQILQPCDREKIEEYWSSEEGFAGTLTVESYLCSMTVTVTYLKGDPLEPIHKTLLISPGQSKAFSGTKLTRLLVKCEMEMNKNCIGNWRLVQK